MRAATFLAPLLALTLLGQPALAEGARDTSLQPSESWEAIRYDVLGEAETVPGEAVLTLDAPFRAEDAATVPIRVTQSPGGPRIERMILVVDENPAPVVAEFTFGAAMDPVEIETRVRVDAYSNVRVIAVAADGTHYMTGRFVRASGGCSAPASKDAEAALAALGEMRARIFEDAGPVDGRAEAQVMLRHPNYSGLQRNQVTHLYVPARFVDTLSVRQDDALLFSMTGGISISEDPTFRFRFTPSGSGALSVEATDTDGMAFSQSFPVGS